MGGNDTGCPLTAVAPADDVPADGGTGEEVTATPAAGGEAVVASLAAFLDELSPLQRYKTDATAATATTTAITTATGAYFPLFLSGRGAGTMTD